MATERFLMTLQKFIVQRGEPDIIQCGKRSNYVGVEKDKIYTMLTMIL